jgi:hypothetical protein
MNTPKGGMTPARETKVRDQQREVKNTSTSTNVTRMSRRFDRREEDAKQVLSSSRRGHKGFEVNKKREWRPHTAYSHTRHQRKSGMGTQGMARWLTWRWC